ncbi:hypothetical protein GGR58DRAFT_467599 [Xylaria digitata]|nr:hypothetical protein GGR58DRAFT_467599 [Xylaria digitata]
MNYNGISWSKRSETPYRTISVSGITVSLSKMVGIAVPFVIAWRQYTPPKRELIEYSDIIAALRATNIILYDTHSRRGWHIDAERAVLQILHHRSKIRNGYIDEPGTLNMGTPVHPGSVQTAIERNERLRLRGRAWNAGKGEQVDVWFSGEVKEIMDILMELQRMAREEYNRCVRDNIISHTRISHTHLIGFEYMAPVDSTEQKAMKVELDSGCGSWPNFANDISAVVSLAKSFPEILLPRWPRALCQHYQKLPSGKSYLAMEVKAIKELLNRHSDGERPGRLTANDMFLVTPMITFDYDCNHKAHNCPCKRVQELERNRRNRNNEIADLTQEFFPGANGAFIFGKAPATRQFWGGWPRTRAASGTTSTTAVAASENSGITGQDIDSVENDGGKENSVHPTVVNRGNNDQLSSVYSSIRHRWQNLHKVSWCHCLGPFHSSLSAVNFCVDLLHKESSSIYACSLFQVNL